MPVFLLGIFGMLTVIGGITGIVELSAPVIALSAAAVLGSAGVLAFKRDNEAGQRKLRDIYAKAARGELQEEHPVVVDVNGNEYTLTRGIERTFVQDAKGRPIAEPETANLKDALMEALIQNEKYEEAALVKQATEQFGGKVLPYEIAEEATRSGIVIDGKGRIEKFSVTRPRGTDSRHAHFEQWGLSPSERAKETVKGYAGDMYAMILENTESTYVDIVGEGGKIVGLRQIVRQGNKFIVRKLDVATGQELDEVGRMTFERVRAIGESSGLVTTAHRAETDETVLTIIDELERPAVLAPSWGGQPGDNIIEQLRPIRPEKHPLPEVIKAPYAYAATDVMRRHSDMDMQFALSMLDRFEKEAGPLTSTRKLVLVFDERAVNFSKARVERLARNDRVQVMIISENGTTNIDGAIAILQEGEAALSERVRQAASEKGIKPASITIVLQRGASRQQADKICADINGNEERDASYVWITDENQTGSIGEIGLATSLNSAIRKNPCLVLVGDAIEQDLVERIRFMLQGLLIFIERVSETLRNILNSIREAQSAV
jgi:hypothetical protein